MPFAMTDTERAYCTLCWTVWMAGVELWFERWGSPPKLPS
jgi:hypothetical protein